MIEDDDTRELAADDADDADAREGADDEARADLDGDDELDADRDASDELEASADEDASDEDELDGEDEDESDEDELDGEDEDASDEDEFDAAEVELDDLGEGRGALDDLSFASGRLQVRFTVAPRRKAPRWFVRALARRVARAARRLGLRAGSAVTCHLVDDPAIARLNAEHMGKVGPTDVLSFSAGPLGPEAGGALAGDVVISVDAVRRQARARLGISDTTSRTGVKRQVLWGVVVETGAREHVLPDMVEGSAEAAAAVDEATVLAVHGLCHLLGHDHGLRGEARAMHRAERRGLRAAATPDVPRPYGLDPRRERRPR